jgi:hypothetical protein
VTVSNLQLRLPALQRPGARAGFVKAPAPRFLPEGYVLARDFAQRRTRSLELDGENRLRVVAGNGSVRVRLECPAYFEACHRGRVRIVWNPVRGKGKGMPIARGTAGGTLAGGRARVRNLRMTKRGRRLIASRSKSIRIIAVTRSWESAEPRRQRRALGSRFG